mgnify:CR=1 FL=1
MFGSWVTRIPDVQNALELTKSQLGLALLGISIGALTLMPFTSWLMIRFTMGKVVFVTGFLSCIVMLLPVAAPSFIWLIVAGVFVGTMSGILDVAMNAAATAIEERDKVVIMSTCHGMFSLGGMIGALSGSLMAGLGVTPLLHLSVMCVLMVILVFYLQPELLNLPESETEEDTIFVLPKGNLLIIAFIGFGIMLGEGAIADWSAVYLKNTLLGSAYVAGLGFAGFSFAMALGRFYGDGIIPKWGAKPIVRWGSLLGVFGLLLAIFVPSIPVVIFGFTLVGLGFSCVVPILFSAASRMPDVASGTGIAAVTASGMMGFLLGPPLIGFIADAYSLSVGLGLVGVLALLGFLLSNAIQWSGK